MSLMSLLVALMTVKHPCRWTSDAPVTSRKCLLLIWGISAETTSEPLWSFSAPVSAVQSSSQALAHPAPTSLLASRQVSSVTSLAHPVLCLLGCQLWSLTKKGFFFFFKHLLPIQWWLRHCSKDKVIIFPFRALQQKALSIFSKRAWWAQPSTGFSSLI